MSQVISLAEVAKASEQIMKGQVQGRILVDPNK